jgi:histidinol-phosphate aminotransferase
MSRDAHDDKAWQADAIRGFPPYAGPQTSWDFGDNQRRQTRFLHLNESPYPPSPRAIEAAKAAVDELNRYPDIRGHALCAALEARTGVPARRIVLGCGSDELIHFLCETSLEPGDRCVMPAPSFPRYAQSTRMQGAEPVRVKLRADGASDGPALAAAVDARTKLVFACTPNPPSGGFMDAANLEALVARMPDHPLLAIDEAYHEFGRHAGAPDILAATARRTGPWLVLRTFSKAYSLAALRIGYALCGSDAVAEALRKSMLQFKVTMVAQRAALAALEDEAYLQQALERNARERKRLADGFAVLGLRVYPSAGNFISFDLGRPSRPLVEALAARGIMVRDWRDPDHHNEVRVTIGTPDDTDALLAALRTLLGTARS